MIFTETITCITDIKPLSYSVTLTSEEGDWRWKHGKEENLMLSPGTVTDHRSPSYRSSIAFGH